ncbi:hypothetical protein [Serinicoccus sp. LYQ131]|uniref:hypothetical protein n=1 Tax=Serinicoccus sp. LYQ131 TaxID=3378797 RepID=UPI0038549295
MSEGRLKSAEWPLVRGWRRRLAKVVALLLAALFLIRVAQWIWEGWSLDVALGMVLVVSVAILPATQLRQRTRATDDGLMIREDFPFQPEKFVSWTDIQYLAKEKGRWGTWVTAYLSDGRSVKLPGVQPNEIDSVETARPK